METIKDKKTGTKQISVSWAGPLQHQHGRKDRNAPKQQPRGEKKALKIAPKMEGRRSEVVVDAGDDEDSSTC